MFFLAYPELRKPRFQVYFRFQPQFCSGNPGTCTFFVFLSGVSPKRERTENPMMKKLPILLLLLAACWSPAAAREPQSRTVQPQTEIITADSTYELIEQLRNMPNIEVGKGITFRPKNNWFELTMRFRMQNRLSLVCTVAEESSISRPSSSSGNSR